MDDRYKNNGYRSYEKAVYKEPIVEIDKDNIFIKAIPYPIEDSIEQERFYYEGLPLFDRESYMKRSKIQKRVLLGQIKNIRLFLPFHKALEFEFYNTLVESYRGRKMVVNYKTDTYKLIGDVGSGTGTGFAIIGNSGCGKSSSLRSITNHYPQTIIHETDKGEIAQILYLVVSCMPNSNFKAMYIAIGKAIDDALHISMYEPMISKMKTLGMQQQKIVELIETYAIGMIIFDEIQLMDFSSTHEASFEALMTMANQTKVVVAVVGTNDSYDKILKYPRTVRRIGNFIDASFYCQIKKCTAYALNKLSRYQLTDTEIKITDDLVEAIHNETRGVISIIVSLYIAMQDDYIENDLKGPIDGKYATKIFKKYFPKIREVLQRDDIRSHDIQLATLLKESDNAYKRQLEELKQRATVNEMTENIADTDMSEIVRTVTRSIMLVTDQFSTKQIETAIKKIVGRSKNKDIDIDALVKTVFKKLNESQVKVAPKISKENMISNILT